MKAREYAQMFNNAVESGKSPADTIVEILHRFLREAEELQDSRKAVTDAAYAAILRELSEKWRAFARLSPGVMEDGFYNAVMLALEKKPDLIAALHMNGFVR